MEPAGDDGVARPQPHPDADDTAGGDSFDPGLETGYLRRAPRNRGLTPELGAAPFAPGPGRYDERRAEKEAKRRERQERRRRPTPARVERTLSEARPAADPTAPAAAVQPVRKPDPKPAPRPPEPSGEQIAVTKLEREPAPVAQLHRRGEPLAERLERERRERERIERERRAKIERERAERERAERELRDRRRR